MKFKKGDLIRFNLHPIWGLKSQELGLIMSSVPGGEDCYRVYFFAAKKTMVLAAAHFRLNTAKIK